jgi:hypothetical protein
MYCNPYPIGRNNDELWATILARKKIIGDDKIAYRVPFVNLSCEYYLIDGVNDYLW